MEAKNCIFNIKKVKPCQLRIYIQSPTLIESQVLPKTYLKIL